MNARHPAVRMVEIGRDEKIRILAMLIVQMESMVPVLPVRLWGGGHISRHLLSPYAKPPFPCKRRQKNRKHS